jgi:hypothetical protein
MHGHGDQRSRKDGRGLEHACNRGREGQAAADTDSEDDTVVEEAAATEPSRGARGTAGMAARTTRSQRSRQQRTGQGRMGRNWHDGEDGAVAELERRTSKGVASSVGEQGAGTAASHGEQEMACTQGAGAWACSRE